MLKVTSKSAEAELGLDFAEIYQKSTLFEQNKELTKQSSSPTLGSKPLQFPTRFPRNGTSFPFGILFWQQGINNQQGLFNIFGAMYSAMMYYGISNCSNVLPLVATERTVLHTERFVGMYSSWANSFAQVQTEAPYMLAHAILYAVITYPMIGFQLSASKILWAFYAIFCMVLSFNYQGMQIVSVTPNLQVANILTSSTYTMLSLFCRFFVPRPGIPIWWLWLYYICPTSWALNVLLTSQFGDINKEILVFGETKAIAEFVQDYFGFHHSFLGVIAAVLIIFPIPSAALFACSIARLNFWSSGAVNLFIHKHTKPEFQMSWNDLNQVSF